MAIYRNKKCEECGGVLLFNDNGYSVVCEDCNQEYLLTKLNENDSNNNKIDSYVDFGKSWSLTPEELKRNIETALQLKDFYKVYYFCDELELKTPDDINIYLYRLLADMGVSNKIELVKLKKDFLNNENYKALMQIGDNTLKIELQDYLKQIQINKKIEQEKIELHDIEIKKALEQAFEQNSQKKKKNEILSSITIISSIPIIIAILFVIILLFFGLILN